MKSLESLKEVVYQTTKITKNINIKIAEFTVSGQKDERIEKRINVVSHK